MTLSAAVTMPSRSSARNSEVSRLSFVPPYPSICAYVCGAIYLTLCPCTSERTDIRIALDGDEENKLWNFFNRRVSPTAFAVRHKLAIPEYQTQLSLLSLSLSLSLTSRL
jgi:hypothetical protein